MEYKKGDVIWNQVLAFRSKLLFQQMIENRSQGDRADLVIFIASGRVEETQVRLVQP